MRNQMMINLWHYVPSPEKLTSEMVQKIMDGEDVSDEEIGIKQPILPELHD